MRRRERRRLRCRRADHQAGPDRVPESDRQSQIVGVLKGILDDFYDGLTGSAYAAVYLLFELRSSLGKRSWDYWTTMVMLTIAAIGIVGTWFGVLRSTPSDAKVRFNTGVVEGAGAGGSRSFATPQLHEHLHLKLQLTPAHQELQGVAISITPPPSVKLTSGCFYTISGVKGKRSCLEPSGDGRIDVDHLASGETLTVAAEAQVVHPVEGEETIEIMMSSADTDANQKQIDLYSPRGTHSEETARKYVQENVEGPLHWQVATLNLRDDLFKVLGDEWPFLDPTRLHGLDEVPYGRLVNPDSFADNRLLGPRIVTFSAVVGSDPIRVRAIRSVPRQIPLFEEVVLLGKKSGGRHLWCTTTRSPSQTRLRPGDSVLVRASLVGWGLARPYGDVVQAAMLICPVIHLTGHIRPAAGASASGGITAPP